MQPPGAFSARPRGSMLRNGRQFLKRLPVLRAVFQLLYRFTIAARYYGAPLRALLIWLLHSRETTNFTYDLKPINKRYLAAQIADITGTPFATVYAYIAELEQDQELRTHIRDATLRSSERFSADATARYGRRLGWYAIVRAVKPKIVVETGVDKGLGSCVLTAALRRNAQEGHPGYYYGIDINPRAGFLLAGSYRQYGEILYGDSLAVLEQLDQTIDLFINDSDHSANYEANEYTTIAGKLSAHALILGDNAHVTDQLLNFALATGRQFVFFAEAPDQHWYPGAGIGIAFRRATTQAPPASTTE